MEQLMDGLQFVGFLVVAISVLVALVGSAAGLAIFLYLADRNKRTIAGPPSSRAPLEAPLPTGTAN